MDRACVELSEKMIPELVGKKIPIWAQRLGVLEFTQRPLAKHITGPFLEALPSLQLAADRLPLWQGGVQDGQALNIHAGESALPFIHRHLGPLLAKSTIDDRVTVVVVGYISKWQRRDLQLKGPRCGVLEQTDKRDHLLVCNDNKRWVSIAKQRG